MDSAPQILVVDDLLQNAKLLEAILMPRGYTVLIATSGREALETVSAKRPDLVLLDIQMPELSGYEVCQQLKADPLTRMIPIVMVTSSGEPAKLEAIESGADDFIARPFDQPELLARVRSLLRIKTYHDTIQGQAKQLAEWNQMLEHRVQQQVNELERLNRLRGFFTPQLAELIVSGGDKLLESHRREITVVLSDLRGFTAFAAGVEPEEVMAVLSEFYEGLGTLIFQFEGTLQQFWGDAIITIFNDPIPCPDPGVRAVRLAVAMRDRVAEMRVAWHRRGYDLDLGVGIAQGYATLGRIGFKGRFDYTAIGRVVNVAARLCDEARGGQILLDQRALAAVDGLVKGEAVGPLTLKGFPKPIPAFSVLSIGDSQADR